MQILIDLNRLDFSLVSVFFSFISDHCKGHIFFQGLEYQLQENVLHTILIVALDEIFAKFKCIFNPLKTDKFYDVAYPYKLITS